MLKQTWKLDQKLNLVTKMMRDVGLTVLFVTDQTLSGRSLMPSWFYIMTLRKVISKKGFMPHMHHSDA